MRPRPLGSELYSPAPPEADAKVPMGAEDFDELALAGSRRAVKNVGAASLDPPVVPKVSTMRAASSLGSPKWAKSSQSSDGGHGLSKVSEFWKRRIVRPLFLERWAPRPTA